jgi:hypothetical protein
MWKLNVGDIFGCHSTGIPVVAIVISQLSTSTFGICTLYAGSTGIDVVGLEWGLHVNVSCINSSKNVMMQSFSCNIPPLQTTSSSFVEGGHGTASSSFW